jgi:hypothetical protein
MALLNIECEVLSGLKQWQITSNEQLITNKWSNLIIHRLRYIKLIIWNLITQHNHLLLQIHESYLSLSWLG